MVQDEGDIWSRRRKGVCDEGNGNLLSGLGNYGGPERVREDGRTAPPESELEVIRQIEDYSYSYYRWKTTP